METEPMSPDAPGVTQAEVDAVNGSPAAVAELLARLDSEAPTIDDWAAEVVRLETEVARLNAVIKRIQAVPGDHRDFLLDNPPLRWSTKQLETARDTCDVLRHKINAEVNL